MLALAFFWALVAVYVVTMYVGLQSWVNALAASSVFILIMIKVTVSFLRRDTSSASPQFQETEPEIEGQIVAANLDQAPRS